jgi:hypothetical protein
MRQAAQSEARWGDGQSTRDWILVQPLDAGISDDDRLRIQRELRSHASREQPRAERGRTLGVIRRDRRQHLAP